MRFAMNRDGRFDIRNFDQTEHSSFGLVEPILEAVYPVLAVYLERRGWDSTFRGKTAMPRLFPRLSSRGGSEYHSFRIGEPQGTGGVYSVGGERDRRFPPGMGKVQVETAPPV